MDLWRRYLNSASVSTSPMNSFGNITILIGQVLSYMYKYKCCCNAAIEKPRAKKCAHYRYLTKLFRRTGYVLFRLSTIVEFFRMFCKPFFFALLYLSYALSVIKKRGQIFNLKKKCFRWCLPGEESNSIEYKQELQDL
jgi:hypothetical protein